MRNSSPVVCAGYAAAGFMVSFVCFGLLPPVLTRWGLYHGVAVLVAGAAVMALTETVVARKTVRHIITGLALAAALVLSRLSVNGGVCFAAGMLLYTACGAVLPDGKRGIAPPDIICAALGFAAGVWLTA